MPPAKGGSHLSLEKCMLPFAAGGKSLHHPRSQPAHRPGAAGGPRGCLRMVALPCHAGNLHVLLPGHRKQLPSLRLLPASLFQAGATRVGRLLTLVSQGHVAPTPDPGSLTPAPREQALHSLIHVAGQLLSPVPAVPWPRGERRVRPPPTCQAVLSGATGPLFQVTRTGQE